MIPLEVPISLVKIVELKTSASPSRLGTTVQFGDAVSKTKLPFSSGRPLQSPSAAKF